MLHHGAHGDGAVGLEQQLALDLGAREDGVDLLAVEIVPREADEGLVRKVRGLEFRLGRQRVVCGQNGHLVQRGQGDGAGAGGRVALLGQAQIESLGRHPFLQQRAILRGHAHRHRALLGLQACECAGQQGVAHGRHAEHADAGLAGFIQRQGMLDHVVEALPTALHLGPERERPRGGAQAALHALEQGVAEQAFQPRQFAAHGGLRGEQQARGTGHAAREHDGAKDFDMAVADARADVFGIGLRLNRLGGAWAGHGSSNGRCRLETISEMNGC